jgi:xylulokinase
MYGWLWQSAERMVTRQPASESVFIGVDVGTSGCKAIALHRTRGVIATGQQSYTVRRRTDGEVSIDARSYLKATSTAVRRALAQLPKASVAGLAITAPAHYAVLVGEDDEPLTRTLLSSDSRPSGTAARLRGAYGEEYFATTFAQLTAGWTFAQLAWLRAQDASLWPRIRSVLVVKDFVRYRLTGDLHTDPTDAAGTGMFDLRVGAWSPQLLHELGLSPAQFPEVRPSISLGSGLNSEWARKLGLRQGTPVAVAATDTAAELVSVGAVHSGSSLVKIASTGTVVVVAASPCPDQRLLTYPHVIPGTWYHLAATSTAATCYTWLRQAAFGVSPREGFSDAYAEMNRLASRVPPGSDGLIFLPFLEGERTPYWNSELRGAWLGLSSAHRRGHLARSVLEGVAFSLQDGRRVLEEVGLRLSAPALGGGGMASRLWERIVVSVLNTPSRAVSPQGPAIGAAMIAAAASEGGQTNLIRALAPAVHIRSIVPDPRWAEAYARIYQAYRGACSAVLSATPGLAMLQPVGRPPDLGAPR